MNKIYSVIAFLLLGILELILYNNYNSIPNLVGLTSFACSIVVLNYIYRYYKTKTGKIIKVGRNTSAYWYLLISFVGGILLFIYSYKYNTNSSQAVSTSMLVSLNLIFLGIFQFSNHSALFKKNKIQFGRSFWWTDWHYKNIDKLEISNDGIVIIRNGDSEYIELTNNDQQKINKIVERLKLRIGGRLIVLEDNL